MMEQANADSKDAQEKLTKLQKQVEAKDKHISEKNRQIKQVRTWIYVPMSSSSTSCTLHLTLM